jgi:hypothetical protein
MGQLHSAAILVQPLPCESDAATSAAASFFVSTPRTTHALSPAA